MVEKIESPWREHQLPESGAYAVGLGRLAVYAMRRGSDLLLVERRVESGTPDLSPDTRGLWEKDYRRYAFEKGAGKLVLRPRIPDRPLVVRPRLPLVLAPGAHVFFYISFPVDAELRVANGDKVVTLERVRSEILSDTWFGEPIAGSYCYALKSRARRDRGEVGNRPANRAICTLAMFNSSEAPLKCDKFCVRLSFCPLWLDPDCGLWASPIRITYQGKEQLSQIDYDSSPPPDISKPIMVTEADEQPQKGVLRRTFGFANLSALGL